MIHGARVMVVQMCSFHVFVAQAAIRCPRASCQQGRALAAQVGGLELDGHPGAGAGVTERLVAAHHALPEGWVVGLLLDLNVPERATWQRLVSFLSLRRYCKSY